MVEEPTKKATPPIHSFKTLVTFLDWLGEVGVPNRIDRSFWTQKLAGGTGIQVMSGMKYLGLLDGETPTDRLETLVKTSERMASLRQLLLDAYPILSGLNLEKATQGELVERFKQLALDAESQRKAITFFVHAAKYCELPLSPHILRRAKVRQANGAKTAKKKSTGKGKIAEQQPPPPATTEAKANERKVALGSGGELKLTVSVDPFTLTSADRDFVFGLIDKIREYEEAKG